MPGAHRRTSLSIPGVGDFRLPDSQLATLLDGIHREEAVDDPARRVLEKICREGPYHSSLTLLADLWDNDLWLPLLEHILLELNTAGQILYNLVLITDSRLAGKGGYQQAFNREIPSRIRATKAGYVAIGLGPEHWAHEIGGSRRVNINFVQRGPKFYRYDPAKGKNWADMTRVWHHDIVAKGGEIEKMALAAHCRKYPDHPHGEQMDDWSKREFTRSWLIGSLPKGAEVDIDKEVTEVMATAGTTRVAREIMQQGKTNWQAVKEAHRLLLDQQTAPPALWSYKECVLEALVRMNVNAGVNFDTLSDFMKAMDRPGTPDHLTGALWSLQKAQLVAFKETKSQHGSQLTRIRITMGGRDKIKLLRDGVSPTSTIGKLPQAKGNQKGRHPVGVDMTEEKNHYHVARAEPATVIHPDGTTETKEPVRGLPRHTAPLPQNMRAPLIDEISSTEDLGSPSEDIGKETEVDTHTQYRIDFSKFPLINSLVEHRAERAQARVKAAKLVEAASLIADIDPSQADVLMQRAADMEGPSPTGLEKEVLMLIDEITGEDPA